MERSNPNDPVWFIQPLFLCRFFSVIYTSGAVPDSVRKIFEEFENIMLF